MNVYNQGLETALKRNVFARDFERQQKIRDVYANPQTYAGLPSNIKTLAQSLGAAGDSKGAGSLIASALGRTPKYNVQKIGPNRYGVVNQSTGAIGNIPGSDNQSPQFAGTNNFSVSANMVMSLQDKIKNGTASPQEQMAYKLGFESLSRSRRENRLGPNGETIIVDVPGIDMKGFAPPNLPVRVSSSQTPATSNQPQLLPDASSISPTTQSADKVVSRGLPTKPSQAELESAAFYKTMMVSQNVIDEIEDAKGEDAYPNIGQVLVKEIPGLGGYIQRKMMTPAQQRYTAAALDWMTSTLRDESGAAISRDEAAKQYDRYFPVPGDGPEVVADKKALRATVTQSMSDRSLAARKYIEALGGTKKEAPKPLTVDEIRKKFGLPTR
jgi:hypothetical protein